MASKCLSCIPPTSHFPNKFDSPNKPRCSEDPGTKGMRNQAQIPGFPEMRSVKNLCRNDAGSSPGHLIEASRRLHRHRRKLFRIIKIVSCTKFSLLSNCE